MNTITEEKNTEKNELNNEQLTPMLKQYIEIKDNYKEHVLFYRLGDFYEMFFEDAEKISRELELTLTSRAGTPMCGVPHHSSEVYVKKLIDRGYKVAICEQIGEPVPGKWLVERAVVRVITAGTLIEDSMLDEARNNFIACFFVKGDICGLVFADLSTGELIVFEKQGKNLEAEIITEISRYMPVELIFNADFMSFKEVGGFVKTKLERCTGEVLDTGYFDASDLNPIKEQFGKVPDELGIGSLPHATCALNALLRYFKETGKNNISRFTEIKVQSDSEFMALNLTSRRNLELTETMRSKERKGSLMWVLDKTKTSMGKRKLRQYIERPLTSHSEILKRQYAVDELVKNAPLLGDIRELLSGIYDIERLMTRIVYKTAGPRDVYLLGNTFSKIPALKASLEMLTSPLPVTLNGEINGLEETYALIENAILPEPPALIKDGNYINDGFNEELDRLRLIKGSNNDILSLLEEKEKEKTGIKTLRVGYNRIFGYYIEVSKGSIENVPPHYVRKQTLANGERYITEELKRIENEILGAHDKILALEAEIFAEVRGFISERLDIIQATAEAVAALDVLCSYAEAAIENNYCRPEITLENVIDIKDGRHPVIEKLLHGTVFTPNDTYLDLNENRLIIITGPNMAGKSTYMRQVALISLMAQIGSFVPARTARLGVVDKIFTRVGASDDLSAGQSTFMVEMNEVADILNNATERSLVILDEIGRGTSTFDGISIAKAVAEHINGKIGCKTLFATHYHELVSLENKNQGIRNFSVAAVKKGDELHFLHKVVEGGADDSYGIEVAKLAGLPQKVITNAKKTLKQMELNSKIELEAELKEREETEAQIDFTSIAKENTVQKLKVVDTNSITPMEALQILAELKKGLGE